ncbi:MAG: ATP-dependent Clp protease proteolytic subunit [Verrucomicrobiales bacterium]
MKKSFQILTLLAFLGLLDPSSSIAQEAAKSKEIEAASSEPDPAEPEADRPSEKSAEPDEKPAEEDKVEPKAEKPKLDPEVNEQGRKRNEISKLSLERELITARMLHEKEQLAAEQNARRIEMSRKKFEMEERTQRLAEAELARKEAMDAELSDLKSEVAKLKVEQEIAAARAEAKIRDVKLAEAESKAKLMRLTAEIAVKEKGREANYYSDQEPQQLDNPLRGKRLVVSDRRIELNGPIGTSTAEHLATRINFYNNKDAEKPIFIVIDNSPGGSVMSGYKILRAMEGSEAPIWVVVKQYAASMAATIATLADHSAAYPNAIILHHQLSGGIAGNLTEQREGLENIEEWWKRLAEPIAKKMGISTEQFIDRMYDEVSSGDWMEFADDAQQLKWIDHVVDEIHETALVKSPDARRTVTVKPTVVPVRRTIVGQTAEAAIPIRATGMDLYEQIDEEGNPFVRLPRPNPIDLYYMHNPDSYYRFR